MDLTQLANLGEFSGGVAVLVTLIYLARQVRQSTAAQTTAAEIATADAAYKFVNLNSSFPTGSARTRFPGDLSLSEVLGVAMAPKSRLVGCVRAEARLASWRRSPGGDATAGAEVAQRTAR